MEIRMSEILSELKGNSSPLPELRLLSNKYNERHLGKRFNQRFPNSAFVIGLEGEWGSGKTTIINNVKKKLRDNENVIIIENFDPWIYGTQNALLMAMYDSILRETGVRYSVYHEKRIIKSLSDLLVDCYSVGNVMQNLFFSQRGDYDEAQEIITRLKQYVERTNKTIVLKIICYGVIII